MISKRIVACALAAVALSPSAGIGQELASGVVVSPKIPGDIAHGAGKTPLVAAAEFAWNEFIALNWPAEVAKPGTPVEVPRETPDLALPFGQGAASPANQRPLVWETFRHKVEIFPSHTQANDSSATPTPHGYGPDRPRLGYDAPPLYPYDKSYIGGESDLVAPCPGQAPVAQAAWVNLDETSEIGLAGMHAGVNAGLVSDANTDVTLFRYLAKANYVEYKYVAENDFWYHSPALAKAEAAFQAAIAPTNHHPSLAGTVQFPAGTIEIKSAWRPLTETEAKSGRFHQLPVRFYEKLAGPQQRTCYFEKTWGLISLHIIQKTPSAPEFVFATFEQADAILTKDGRPVEDDDGKPTAATPLPGPTQPIELYVDKPDFEGGPVVAVNNAYCGAGTKSDQRLFFKELSGNPALPSGGPVCVNQRAHAIENEVIAVNQQAHRAIAAYNEQKGVKDSPFAHYKLVSVQASPIDKSQIGAPGKSASTFFQANIAVETDYTLQNFSGRLSSGGPGTDYPAGSAKPDFKNVYHFVPGAGGGASHFDAFNAGGCQGCHGNAQVGGTDFSFILDGNTFNKPEAPDETLALKYLPRF